MITHDCATVPGLGTVAQSCGRFCFPTDDWPAHQQRGDRPNPFEEIGPRPARPLSAFPQPNVGGASW